jgi:hypothetical protein
MDSSESSNEKELQKASNSSIKILELTLEEKILCSKKKLQELRVYT